MIRKGLIVALTTSAVAVLVLWVASYPGRPGFSYFVGGTQNTVQARFANGQFILSLHVGTEAQAPPPQLVSALPPPAKRRGFSYVDKVHLTRYRDGERVERTRRLECPAWVVFVAFFLYPAIVLVRNRVRAYHRRQEASLGHKAAPCTTCGYDLTGNVSGVCPECGEKS